MKNLFEQIKQYKSHLINEEKSAATVEKYIRDIAAFYVWLDGEELTKETALIYKQELIKEMQLQA